MQQQPNNKQTIYERVLELVVSKLESGNAEDLTPQMIQSIVSLLKLDSSKVVDSTDNNLSDMISQLVQDTLPTSEPSTSKLSHHFQQP